MKLKPTVLLATFVVTMGLLLGTNAESQTDPDQIISNWIDGILYWDAIESTMGEMTGFITMKDIAAGEFTGDGKDDVASIWANGLWYQDGATLEWTLVTQTAPVRVTAGDVTGDGRDEIIGIWENGIWYWDGTKLPADPWTQMTQDVGATDIAAGDFTADGFADVASIWPNGLFYQDGANLDDWIEVDKLPPIRVTAGDITDDGRDEIIANWSEGLFYWDVAESKYTQIPTISPPTGDIAAGDFTGDGIADVAAIYDSGLWWVDGAAPTWKLARGADPAVTGEGPWSVTAGDVKPGAFANAGEDTTGSVGTDVDLDGSLSSPAGGDFFWSVTSLPSGSTFWSLINETTATPTFRGDLEGLYIITLQYTVDGETSEDSVNVLLGPQVLADAGEEQDVEPGDLVTLDGSASTPAGGQYLWVFTPLGLPDGSAAVLTGATTATPTFVADVEGKYTIKLTYTVGPTSSDAFVDVLAEESIIP